MLLQLRWRLKLRFRGNAALLLPLTAILSCHYCDGLIALAIASKDRLRSIALRSEDNEEHLNE